MRSFSYKFARYLETGDINLIEIGVGPYGEPRYPYSPISTDFGNIGEFMIMTRGRANFVTITCGKALLCAGKEDLEQTFENVKRGLYDSFTYSLISHVIEPEQYRELAWFVKKMHVLPELTNMPSTSSSPSPWSSSLENKLRKCVMSARFMEEDIEMSCQHLKNMVYTIRWITFGIRELYQK